MAGNRVPQTVVRLSQQLALIGFHQADEVGNPFSAGDALNILSTLTSLKFISATSRFRVTQEGENQRRYGINSSREAWITVPGRITTRIEMDRVALNTGDVMSAFQFLPGNIAFQTRPLIIIELIFPALGEDNLPVVRAAQAREISNITNGLTRSLGGLPGASTVLGQSTQQLAAAALSLVDLASTPVYMGCWIGSRATEYKLEGSQAVMENVSLDVSRISPAINVVAPSLEETLITNLPVVSRGVDLARSVGRAL